MIEIRNNIDDLEKIILFIVNDRVYIDYMDRIKTITFEFAELSEINGSIAFNHDLEHAIFVAKTTEKLLEMLKCDERTCKLGYIAGLLHDIGMIDGKKGHVEKGVILAKEYLKQFCLTVEEKNLILSAIGNHGDCDNMNSLIDACITIADKTHFDRSRVIKSKYSYLLKLNNIISNQILIDSNNLIIKYEVDQDFNKAIFYIIPKSIDILVDVAGKLNLKPIFYINDKEDTFADRDEYDGYVYGKN